MVTGGVKGTTAGCAVAAVMVLILGLLLLVAMAGGSQAACAGGPASQPATSGAAESGIPDNYLKMYQAAGKQYGIPWNVLAGIGKVETDHGRSRLPGVTSGENFAGAGGPMQFLEPTWEEFGVDGNNDGRKDRYDPADAIPGAAHYLSWNVARSGSLKAAILAYNHSEQYYRTVMSWAARYGSGDFSVAGDNNAGTTCVVALGGGSALGSAIVAYAVQFKGLPYIWGGEDPNSGFDCSGLVQYVYGHFGIRLPRTADLQAEVGQKFTDDRLLQPGDLVFSGWDPAEEGSNGVGHVGIYAGGGQIFEASQRGVPLHFVPWNATYRAHLRWFTRVTQLAKGGAAR